MKKTVKKYQSGGTTNAKKISATTPKKNTPAAKSKTTVVMEKNKYTTDGRTSIKTNSKGNVQKASNRDTKKKYTAYDSGVVAVENMGGAPKYSAAIDTTGYSAGKKSFPTTVKKGVKVTDGREGTKVTKYSTSRENVMPTLKRMEATVTTPKKKTAPKKASTAGKSLMYKKGGSTKK